MIDSEAARDFSQRVIEKARKERTTFTKEVVEEIAAEFSLPADKCDEIGLLLEVGANAFIYETRRASLDFEISRRELRRLQNAANEIQAVLQNLSADTLDVLFQAGIARGLNGFHLPRISDNDLVPFLHYQIAGDQEAKKIALVDLVAIISMLGQCALDAKPLARGGRIGRPEQEALFDLLIFAFQVWETVSERTFKLDWAPNGEPITDAARFCVRVARCVEPTLTFPKISTSARKVRETFNKINNLK